MSWVSDDPLMPFESLDDISEVETFAVGSGIHEIARLRRLWESFVFAWRSGSIQLAEIDCTRPLA